MAHLGWGGRKMLGTGRAAARASVDGDVVGSPPARAGLHAGSASVCTRPPLSASAASCGSTVIAPQVPSRSIEATLWSGRPSQSRPLPLTIELASTFTLLEHWGYRPWMPTSVLTMALPAGS